MRDLTFLNAVILLVLTGCGQPPMASDDQTNAVENIATVALPDPTPSGLESTEKQVKLGETQVTIRRTSSPKKGLLYFRPHEDEQTSRPASLHTVAKYGGTYVELGSTGNRMISFQHGGQQYVFDPNRIFTKEGIEDTLKRNGKTSADAVQVVNGFAQRLVREYLQGDLIVAVHNNTDGGPLSIQTYLQNKDALQTFVNPERDPDDFFLTTKVEHFEMFKKAGFNTVLQDSENVLDDGSLSVYYGRTGLAYINVEAQRGHLKEQMEMLAVLNDLMSGH